MDKNRVDRLEKLLTAMIGTLERADCSTGDCCCGDPMEGHDNGMHCGHAPVDIGVYHADALIENARKELELLKGDQ